MVWDPRGHLGGHSPHPPLTQPALYGQELESKPSSACVYSCLIIPKWHFSVSPGYGDVAIFQRKWSWRVARSWCSAKLKIAFNRLLIYCLGYGPHECCFRPQILKIRTKGYFPPAFTADGVVTVAFIVEQKISSKCRISVHHSHKCVSVFKGKQEAGIQTRTLFQSKTVCQPQTQSWFPGDAATG